MLSTYSFRNLRLNVNTYKQNLALNNLQGLICHKTQPTNQPTNLNTANVFSSGRIRKKMTMKQVRTATKIHRSSKDMFIFAVDNAP